MSTAFDSFDSFDSFTLTAVELLTELVTVKSLFQTPKL